MSETVKPNYRTSGNPYLPLWEHTPDGEPRVFEDPDNPGQYRIYVIGSHDTRVEGYCGYDIRVWSAPVDDLSNWRDDGPVFTYEVDGRWDIMYAPDLVELKHEDGRKEYYLYPHSRGKGRVATVAKGDRPDGPFTPINIDDAGTNALPGSIMGFDPGVWVEYITDPADLDYGVGYRAYGYWGFKKSFAAELDQNGMYSVREGRRAIERFIPAGASGGDIGEDEGMTYPHVCNGEDLHSFNFFEASSIRKVGNKFLFIYAGHSGSEYGLNNSTATLRYAYGDTPMGPWKSGGVLVDARAILPNQEGTELQATFAGHNTHGSIEQINDQYYVFYHRCPREFGHARQAMVAPVTVEWDERPVAEGGIVSIRGYNPYQENSPWVVDDIQGNSYIGAEVTSEGFHIFGLPPYAYYSAGYACYLSNQDVMQDSYDIWDNHMPITKAQNGLIVGYKYFGFGGLQNNVKGLKSFEGTKPGNNTAFNLCLFPLAQQSFKISIWLDGPWDNDIWNGREIGSIVVPSGCPQKITKFAVDVSESVDSLDGKHALFLIVEGPESEDLCDLIGLGFSSDAKPIVCTSPPAVDIKVDGIALELPEHPVAATSSDGIVGYDLFRITHTASKDGATPRVSASADDPEILTTVTQANAENSEATVSFDYNGIVKTYGIQFRFE